MLRSLLVMMLLSSTPLALASSRITIFPGGKQGVIYVEKIDRQTGDISNDPDILYDAMLVPVVGSEGGDRGKIIEPEDKTITFICAERVQTGIKGCQIIIKQSPFSTIDGINRHLNYKITGENAIFFANALLANGVDSYYFKSSDGKLAISVKREAFEISYQD